VKEGVKGREGGREAILGDLGKHPLSAQSLAFLGMEVEEEVEGREGGTGGGRGQDLEDAACGDIVAGFHASTKDDEVGFFVGKEGGKEGFLLREQGSGERLDVGAGERFGGGGSAVSSSPSSSCSSIRLCCYC